MIKQIVLAEGIVKHNEGELAIGDDSFEIVVVDDLYHKLKENIDKKCKLILEVEDE